jgi:hypothetical protein
MRFMLLPALLAALAAPAWAPPAPEAARDFVQAVEFPYYLYPRHLWERELVWLRTIGIRTIEFSIPWNWHEPRQGEFDFTGATSPRRDLIGFVRLLRRLELQAWIRPLPGVKGWINGGQPAWAGTRAQHLWLAELEKVISPQLQAHGGPVAFVEGVSWAEPAPAPVTTISANDPGALARSRQALAAGRGALVWEQVEDALFPAGWANAGGVVFQKGAVSLNGDERATASALRRDAALLKNWSSLLAPLKVQPLAVKFPARVAVAQLLAKTPGHTSALSIINNSSRPFAGELRARDFTGKRVIQLPPLEVAPGEALWLPIEMPLAAGGLCSECSAFAKGESIVYATAELQAVEFENGILAMEFAAPRPGEVMLQLSRQPSGPFLAGGRPTDFDWDEKTMRARLPIPAGKGAASHVRIGLAIEPPETSAFFVNAGRLVIGRKNVVSTSYSSEQLATRSRLRLPEGFSAKPTVKSPTEIDYDVDVPADALHGNWVNFGIEADGVLLGRARLQLFRPASVRVADAAKLHFGSESELQVEPLVIALDPKATRNLDVIIRNNTPQIQNFELQASADGWEFLPAKTEISIGAIMERTVSLRAFAKEPRGGLFQGRLRVSGGATQEIPLRIASVPRGETIGYTLDLDGDGMPEWVLENQRVRATFSARDGGRWMEFVWKDTGANFLPEQGDLAGAGSVEVRPVEGGLEFKSGGWTRTVRLNGARLTVEQTSTLPAEVAQAGKRDGVSFEIARESAERRTYSLGK